MVSVLMLVLMILPILTGCNNTETNADAEGGGEKTVIKLAHVSAPEHNYNMGAKKFKELVESKVGDQIEIQIYPAAQLGSGREITEGVKMGTIDMMIMGPGELSTYEPAMGLLELPFLYENKEHAFAALDGEIGDKFNKKLESSDMKVLGWWEAGIRNITNSKHPIKTPDDLKGLKIRVPETQTSIETLKALGADATPLGFGELYSALQQGTVDGQENPVSNIYFSKFYEVQKYMSITHHMYIPAGLVMNNNKWNELSEDVQEVMLSAAEEARDYQRDLVQQEDDELLGKLKDEGMAVTSEDEIDKAAFKKAVKPVHEKLIKEVGGDAQELVDEIKTLGEEYE